jgi:hypothetical protein
MTGSARPWLFVGISLALALAAGLWADRTFGWVAPAFDAGSRLFHEIPVTAPVVTIAQIRQPSQIALVRWHATVLMALLIAGCLSAPWVGTHGRKWWLIFCVGYAIRSGVWIAGGNLPLVPGDSCHYLEVASSVAHGEGPVKHYVESFFREYPAIREGRGVLDDWATPLHAYVIAGAFKLLRIEPGRSLEESVAVAKGLSFALNLLTLPVLYGFARRRFGKEVALGAMAVLAILPVHAIYAGFELRESLVALTSVLAVWMLTEVWNSSGRTRWIWAVLAGLCGGLAILARNTALVLLAACALYALAVHARRAIGPLLLWGIIVCAVIAPWAWATYREYGKPFYTYTDFFEYNFSWTVHHYEPGNTLPTQFYTRANAPEIIRVKIKSLLIIAVYTTMIFSLPLALALIRRLWVPPADALPAARDTDRLIAVVGFAFVAGTLAKIADITQVTQLGRYYLPLFVLALPTAIAGVGDWLAAVAIPRRAFPWLAVMLPALLWADPTWAYDATWLNKPYQLHWPALRAAGDWVKEHPEQVPADARIMTWFPWEFRLASGRTTILLPRNFSPERIERVKNQYNITHVLWGSFEPPPESDPESFGPYLDRLRISVGLTDSRELYRTPAHARLPYPVRLYRVK